MKNRTVAVAITGLVGTVLVFAGCGSSKGSSSPSSAANTFVLSEFTIIPPTNTLHPGRVTISANNVGGEIHELIFVRAASADALPTRPDGSIDQEKIPANEKLGEIEEIAAGSRQRKAFDFTGGRYVAFCNIIDAMTGSSSTSAGGHADESHDSETGHVHFAEGMHVTFTVS